MAKNRKVAKSKGAKRKSARRKSARTAASTRAARKSAKRKAVTRKVAKRKVAKRAVAKRVGPVRGAVREDPCRSERAARDRVSDEVDKLREALSDPDIPSDLRDRLETMLRQKQARLAFLQRELDACEAKHAGRM